MARKVAEKRHLWWIESHQHGTIKDGECEYVDFGGSNGFGQWFTPWSNFSRSGLILGVNAFETEREACEALVRFHERERSEINRKLRQLRKRLKSMPL